MNIAVKIPARPSRVRSSPGVTEMAIRFGLRETKPGQLLLAPVDVQASPGRIAAIVGPSGSGKSSILAAIKSAQPESLLVQQLQPPVDRAILDIVRVGDDLHEASGLLTACGIGEPRLWIRAIDELSEGERFRARLACSIRQRVRDGHPAPLLCDEFCSGLHRRAALAVAFNLRKLVTRYGISAVVAASQEDMLHALNPDQVVRLDGQGGSGCQPGRRTRFDWTRRVAIEPGGKRDYDAFSDMHYRPSDELGFVDRVFVMREKLTGNPLGIVVYSHPPLELKLRNYATAGRFKRDPHKLNRELRILRRLVVHPDIRGCGLGHHLVRQTLSEVGTPFIECLAGMGVANPVFEKAGMQRIGQCPLTEQQRAAARQVQNFGLDPMARDFVNAVCRRPRVRRLVTEFVGQWYQATTSSGDSRAARQSPEFLARTFQSLIGSHPVYYLWHRDGTRFATADRDDGD